VLQLINHRNDASFNALTRLSSNETGRPWLLAGIKNCGILVKESNIRKNVVVLHFCTSKLWRNSGETTEYNQLLRLINHRNDVSVDALTSSN